MASAAVGFNSIVLELLNWCNYEDWSSQIETYLLAEDLWDVVKAGPPQPENREDEIPKAWSIKNAKALHAIKISCGTDAFSIIRKTREAKIAWEELEKEFRIPLERLLEKQDKDSSLPSTSNARQTSDVGNELVSAEELETKKGEGGNENNANYEYDTSYGPFFKSVKVGDWDKAKVCLATLHPNAVRARSLDLGRTALHFAAWKEDLHIVKELVPLMTQEDLEIQSNLGFTALHDAVRQGKENVNIVKELVSRMRQEGLVIKSNAGDTALHIAVIMGRVNIVKELVPLMRQEGLVIKNNAGDTALHIAVKMGRANIVKELVPLMRQEGLVIKNNAGDTALHMAVIMGRMNIVKELVPLMRQEGLVIKNNAGDTALHIAVKTGHVNIVEELVSSMREEDLEINNGNDFTALVANIYALHNEKMATQIARHMVQKNKEILSISPNSIPVVTACAMGKWKLGRYLYSITPTEVLLSENGTQGARLINVCIGSGKGLDIALHLLQRCPKLAITDTGFRTYPMLTLAGRPYAFLSGKQLTFLQKWIYHGIHIQPVDFNAPEIAINVSKSEDDQGNQRDLICSVMSLYRRFVKGCLLKLFGINHIYEMKSNHIRVYHILQCMGLMIRDRINSLAEAERNVVKRSIFRAVEQGHVEFVTQMCKAHRPLMYDFGGKGSIFHHAIEYRQERIYNLIYGLKKEIRDNFGISCAKFGNTMLHAAANLSPPTRFNHIQGASLQMQRELQWFKEVENIVPIEKHEVINYSDRLTARWLFTRNHNKLRKEAELSIKGTATACTTVGALIVTIMFAVAFTIPGGTNDKTGLPMFMHKKMFKIFIVSDTISLVSSATSVITCLGILTSRYAEDDFLKSLPTKMIVGLSSLFVSIVAMMITFSCALTIMLDGEAWIIILSILVASIPVISLVWLLFPLLVEISSSTYGPGIFDKKVKPWC